MKGDVFVFYGKIVIVFIVNCNIVNDFLVIGVVYVSFLYFICIYFKFIGVFVSIFIV